MIFIANFKMMLTTPMAVKLIKENLPSYKGFAEEHDIVICPPATALRELLAILNNTTLHLGAQTCSCATAGAFTGEISPSDLAACGATYCIIGHSERRSLYHESNDQIAIKASLLVSHDITPIVCIGESKSDHHGGLTQKTIESQLSPVLHAIAGTDLQKALLIAYEPIWSIGTGQIPQPEELSTIFSSLASFIERKSPNTPYKLLYGGSVSSKTISTLAQVKPLHGFLIGGASLDFQEFKKIVDYFHCPAPN